MVPAIATWLEDHLNFAKLKSRHIGQGLSTFQRLLPYLEPYEVAHLGLTVVLDKIGRGNTFKSRINTVQVMIGRYIEDQAFITYIEQRIQSTLLYFKRLIYTILFGHTRKIYGMKYAVNKSDELSWNWMCPEEHAKLGALVLRAVMSIPVAGEDEGFFETKMVREANSNRFAISATHSLASSTATSSRHWRMTWFTRLCQWFAHLLSGATRNEVAI